MFQGLFLNCGWCIHGMETWYETWGQFGNRLCLQHLTLLSHPSWLINHLVNLIPIKLGKMIPYRMHITQSHCRFVSKSLLTTVYFCSPASKWSVCSGRTGSIPQCIYTKSYMGVSLNRGTPKSILKVFSIINHPFWGTPIFGNTHIYAISYTPCYTKYNHVYTNNYIITSISKYNHINNNPGPQPILTFLPSIISKPFLHGFNKRQAWFYHPYFKGANTKSVPIFGGFKAPRQWGLGAPFLEVSEPYKLKIKAPINEGWDRPKLMYRSFLRRWISEVSSTSPAPVHVPGSSSCDKDLWIF